MTKAITSTHRATVRDPRPCKSCGKPTRCEAWLIYGGDQGSETVPMCARCYGRDIKSGKCWICGGERDAKHTRYCRCGRKPGAKHTNYCRSCLDDMEESEESDDDLRKANRDACLSDAERNPDFRSW